MLDNKLQNIMNAKLTVFIQNYDILEQWIKSQNVTVYNYKTINTIIFTKLILIYTNNAKYNDKWKLNYTN